MPKTVVWIRCQFEAFHRWKDAPEDVGFLKNVHRHIFHVRLGKSVGGLDREIEFFQLKREVQAYINKVYADRFFEASCEMIAEDLLKTMNAEFVEVSEDGENGATTWRE